jgi:hypothetical protein
MATSLLFIRKLVRDRLGIPVHDSYFPDQLIDANINLAILAIEETQRWPWNETTSTLTANSDGLSASVPSDWRATKAIVGSNGTPLGQCVSYDLTKIRRETGSAGVFCIINDSIEFAPAAGDEEFMHIYYREPFLLTTDTDVPRLPSVYVGTIVAKASQLCSTREDDRPSATVHMIEFTEGIERMKKDTRATTRPQQKYIRPGGWI